MNIDKVIFACDDNPYYKDFWKLTSEICYKRLGVTPVLFNITDEDSDFFEDDYGIIKKIKKIEGVDTGYQAQIIRMYGFKYLQNEFCITSDIDMFMLNKEYFIDQLKKYDNNDIIIYSSDAYQGDFTRIPMCYNAGLGVNFCNIFELDDTFGKFVNRLLALDKSWSCDELYLTSQFKKNISKFNFIKLNRGWYKQSGIAYNRIDRVRWSWSEDMMCDYIDCHSLRPYCDNKESIDLLVNSILKNKNDEKDNII